MDIPCAILIAAFCLPETNLQVEVKSDIAGATAIAKFSDVRVSIPLPSEDEEVQRTNLDNQLCLDGYCIPYTARHRQEVSSVDLLIAEPDGRERFIQLKGPIEQVAALSNHISFVYQMRGRWERVPLGEFKVAETQADPQAEAPPPDSPPEALPETFPETLPETLPEPLPEARPETLPDPAPESPLPDPNGDPPPLPEPNRPLPEPNEPLALFPGPN